MLSTSNTSNHKSSYPTTTVAQEFHRVADQQKSLQASVTEYGKLVQYQGQQLKHNGATLKSMQQQLAELQEQINKMQKLSDTKKKKK